MGAPKEVWVNSYGWWVNRYGWHPNGVVYAYRTEVEAARCLQDGGTMARYVLARPKREAVAWVVRTEDGRYTCRGGLTRDRNIADRFQSRLVAMSFAKDKWPASWGGRVVKLVRPVKP